MIEISLAVLALVGAFVFGGRYVLGKKKSEQIERDAKAINRAKEVQDEVGGIGDSDVTDRLRKRSGR